jgi:predicted transposase YdaD
VTLEVAMAKPFDASLKQLVEAYLPDWLALVPRRLRRPARIVSADLSTLTADADKVVRVEEHSPWLLHLELQSGPDATLAQRLAWYNALLSYKHQCPVHTLLVLLTRRADSPKLSGELRDQIGDEPPYRVFRYQVVRVWQLDAEQLAGGSWGLFPLAPLADTDAPKLPGLIDRMGQRLIREIPDRKEAEKLAVTVEILLGLRYDRALTKLMMEKVMNMIDLRESHAYQIILEEGEAKGESKWKSEVILHLATKKFGKPTAKQLRTFNAITDAAKLTELGERLLEVDSWKALLATQ